MTKTSRTIIVKSIYHQVERENPIGVSIKSVHNSESDEQVYDRRMPLDEEWKPLDAGWVEDVGMVSIHHCDGVKVVKDHAADKELLGRFVEVGRVAGDGILTICIVPRDCSTELFVNYPVSDLRLRLSKGSGRVAVRVYPR